MPKTTTDKSSSSAFAWSDTLPCVATYKVLEGDNFMDQFEDASVPFQKAGTITIGSLRFWPQVTDNIDIIGLLADQMARKFLVFVQKTYTITKLNPNEDDSDIIDAIAAVFSNKQKTLTDLAQTLSQQVTFPQTTAGSKK